MAIAQYVGAVDPRFFMVDPRLFIVGLRCECTDSDPAELLDAFEEEDEDGQTYSDLLKERKKTRSKSSADGSDYTDSDSDAEYEYIDEEVTEEVPEEDPLMDVCEELMGFFKETAEGDDGKLDYERALDEINKDRETGSLMDVEKEFSMWLNDLGETEQLTDDQFGELLERVDPKNTNMVGAKQLQAFCDGETWDMERKMKTVKKTIKKKVKKAKSSSKDKYKSPGRSSSKKKKRGKGKKGYLDDSDNSSDDSADPASSDDSDDSVDSFWNSPSKRKFRKSSRRHSSESSDEEPASDAGSDYDSDFISSPGRRSKSSGNKSITGDSKADALVRDVARSLGAKHRNIFAGMEQMLKTEFRRMDVFGNGMLRPDEVTLVLRGLGYAKQTITTGTPGVAFFLDRSSLVDFNGFASAVGQAAWELGHGGKFGGGSVTSSKKLDRKLRT